MTHRWLAALVCLCALVGGFEARAAEEILSFKSHIVVDPDGGLSVTETIRVRAEGKQIKRGIYRDLPATYTAPDGTTQRMHYQVQRVLRDGVGIATFETSEGGGRRIYFGSKDVLIKPGVYTYAFTYRALRQVRFFESFDEVYWNVTGNGWAFPIQSAEALVVLPTGARAQQFDAYTGRAGATGKDFVASDNGAGQVSFATTQTLDAGEGLTVAVGWPKGFVVEPDASAKAAMAVQDNLSLIVGAVGLLLTLAYYLFAWDRVGRDPQSGPIPPLFEPPKGYSAAEARVLLKMGYDNKAFAAAVVSLAVKGAITIREDDGTFTLTPVASANTAKLSKGEAGLKNSLLRNGRSLALKQTHHAKISGAIEVFKAHLNAEMESTHFSTNRTYLIPGAALSVLTIVAMAATSPTPDGMAGTLFMTVWLSAWSFACFSLARRALASWRTGNIGIALFQSLFAVPFFVGEVIGLGMLQQASGWVTAMYMLIVVGLFALFYHLIKAPTLKGRRVLDQLEGFKMFLDVAEKDRLNMFHPPEITPEVFESYLPYAIALDVEHGWSERFAGILKQAGRDPNAQPGWYSGPGWHGRGYSGFATHIGATLPAAVGAASTSPSGSGSGGGGSSGGGGGGGGGGGF